MTPLFFFLTLYMQQVLGYTALKTGLAFLPLTVGVIAVTKNASKIVARFGPRPTLAAGPIIFTGGLYWLSKIPASGSYPTDILPGLLIVSLGAGLSLVSVITAATRGVPTQNAGVAAGLVNTMQRVGTAVGLAVLTDVATSRTATLIAAHTGRPAALTGGFDRAILVASALVAAGGVLGAVTWRRAQSPSAPQLHTLPPPGLASASPTGDRP
jgi:hypothetical protein